MLCSEWAAELLTAGAKGPRKHHMKLGIVEAEETGRLNRQAFDVHQDGGSYSGCVWRVLYAYTRPTSPRVTWV